MRYVAGETLGKKISTSADAAEGGRMVQLSDAPHATARDDLEEILDTIERAARALHVAHEAGVIHRDVKPGNIMITPDGDPVILDFGLARSDDEGIQTLTQSGEIFGTPAYMSPEQLRGGGKALDRRTDVYSLGATLYECLTLRLPFHEPTREALYNAILNDDPKDPHLYNADIPQDVRVVVSAALEKELDRRYASAQDFAEDLRRIREHEPILAKPMSRWTRLQRWWERNRALGRALAAVFLLLVTGLGVTAYFLDKNTSLLQVKDEALGHG